MLKDILLFVGIVLAFIACMALLAWAYTPPKPRVLTVKAFRRRQHAGYGYVGYEWVDVQQLGYQRWWGFVVLDEEIVPNDVKISIGAMGDYHGPWRSKFIDYIPRSRGGHASDTDCLV